MKWKNPPLVKVYEALGTVADGRVEVSGNTGKVYSSSGNKYYDILYDPKKKQIMSNDNASYWQKYLGYPSIAFLMKTKVLSYDAKLGGLLKGVAWKDINQKFKNNFDKALESIISSKTEEEKQELLDFCTKVYGEIIKLNLGMLGKRTLPPAGY